MKHIVLHILQPVSETTIGGADMHVLDLTRSESYQCEYEPVVCLRKNKSLQSLFVSRGICCLCGSEHKSMVSYVKWLNKELSGKNISIIHAHGYQANYQMLLLKLLFPSKWKNTPTIITCHGWIETNPILMIMTKLDLFCHRFAQARIVCSKSNLNRVASYKNAFYVPNGIVPFNVQPSKHSKVVIGFVGRLSKEKRPDKVLQVAKLLSQEYKDKIEIHIIGEGDMLPDLQRAANSELLQDLVFFDGQKDREDIYPNIDILLLTSDSESTPRVVIEALYCKIPVVATNVGSVSELVCHNKSGFLVSKEDCFEMAKALKTLIEQPMLRQSFGEYGHNYVCNHFTAEQMANKISQIYKTILP